ncbi:two-component system, OmpR family, sensor histidine kinase MprB [Microlunatus sagamiharensis]|uniref:histidine kinase n=1 Tax=Microlunatus sagamiharensis TaxID=546874 RepID=A0A1H2N833_9ACTN|nr:two-component system, OmpR family, sensor histidine kinase MprB [Microlunatus sagamiharensis]
MQRRARRAPARAHGDPVRQRRPGLYQRFREWLSTLPLQRRVSYLTTTAVALAVAVSSLAGWVSVRASLYSSLDEELVEVASSLTAPTAQDLSNLGGLTERTLRAGNISVAAVRADGRVYYVPDEREHLVLGPEELAVARLHFGHSARSGETSDGAVYRIVAIPVPELGGVALVVGRPLGGTAAVLTSLLVVVATTGLVGVALAAGTGLAVARSGLRPVRQLSGEVERIAETKDLRPVDVSGAADVAVLARSFNDMVDSLAASRERQRRLIADAGHELRTPLTSLRTNVDLLIIDARTSMLKEGDRLAILGDVQGQLGEFTKLVGDLVQLARDEGEATPEPLDFRHVVTAALERARRRGPSLDFDVELDPFFVVGVSADLERAVTNLLDNAVKWSPPGGTVRVQLEGNRLRVADEGPGIAEADLPHVFDRFFRADTARTTPGTGLGLSIVAQVVHQHGGVVRAGRSAQGGAEFTMVLPGARSSEALEQPARS